MKNKYTIYYCKSCDFEYGATQDERLNNGWFKTKPCNICKEDMTIRRTNESMIERLIGTTEYIPLKE